MDLNLLSEEPYDRRFVVRRAEVEDGKGFGDLLNSQGGQALFRATFGTLYYLEFVDVISSVKRSFFYSLLF